MVTGVECAGLVLAVTPLFIEAAKVYSDGVESILDVTVKSRWDEKLEEFYEEFYFQIVSLNDKISKICASMTANMPNSGKIAAASELLSTYEMNSNIEKALKDYFQSEGNYKLFTRISKRLMVLLGKLIQEKSNRLSSKDEVCRHLIQNFQISLMLLSDRTDHLQEARGVYHRQRVWCYRELIHRKVSVLQKA